MDPKREAAIETAREDRGRAMILYWGLDSDETITATSVDEYMEKYLDGRRNPVPGGLIVQAYKRKEVEPDDIISLEDIYEGVREQHYYPEAEYDDEPGAEVVVLYNCLVHAIQRDFKSCLLEATGRSEYVGVENWVRDHRPDWLDQITFEEHPSPMPPAAATHHCINSGEQP